jgi:hypothetical protein
MGDSEEAIRLRFNEPQFKYLTTVMGMYVDCVKGYIQVATGALVVPIVFLRNIVGLRDGERIGWIPGPMKLAWVLLLMSIGAGLFYQIKAARYLEIRMEGSEVEQTAKWSRKLEGKPGLVFDAMAISFYLGNAFLVVGAVEAAHWHWTLPYVVCPTVAVIVGVAYKFVF